MATTNTNWVYDNEKVPDSSKKALEKAHRMESELMEDGWRWVKVSKNTSILVPFDKSGNITKKGEDMIESVKMTCT